MFHKTLRYLSARPFPRDTHKFVSSGKNIFVVFTDLSETFDRIWKGGVVLKLLQGVINVEWLELLKKCTAFDVKCQRSIAIIIYFPYHAFNIQNDKMLLLSGNKNASE